MKSFRELVKIIEDDLEERKVMNITQRRALARRMKRLAKSASFKRKRQLSLRRVATGDKLKKRAMKAAKLFFIKKCMGNVDYKSIPIAQKMRIDQQILSKKGSAITKIAKKIERQLRKKEVERVRKLRQTKKD